MLRPVLILLLVTPLLSLAQKPDQRVLKGLQADIVFLSSDALEGRAAGSDGESKAAAYLADRYEKLKIPAYGDAYLHPFRFIHGLEMSESHIVLGGQSNLLGGDAFPMPFSGNGSVSGDVLIEVQEQGAIWLLPLYESAAEAANTEYDWAESAWTRARQAQQDGATGVVFYDSYEGIRQPRFDRFSTRPRLGIPVVYVGYEQWKSLSANDANMVSVALDIHISKPERKSANVLAWIDNKASKTIVIGANYDGRGYGEMIMSARPDAGKHPYNGADDNGSGTAAVLQLAESVKRSRLRNFNYVFANFSGGNLGQLGAAEFCKETGFDKTRIAGMIDLYMIGLLPDSTQELMLSVASEFPAQNLIPGLLKKAGLKARPLVPRSGGSDAQVFGANEIAVLEITASPGKGGVARMEDYASQINYPGEARILAFIQAFLKKLDMAGAK